MTSVAEPVPTVPVHSGQNRCEGPAPASGSTLDETEEIMNDILVVRSIKV